jgi:hypothetical protein
VQGVVQTKGSFNSDVNGRGRIGRGFLVFRCWLNEVVAGSRGRLEVVTSLGCHIMKLAGLMEGYGEQ